MASCFFISPIGSPDSKERRRSDQLFNFILKDTLRGVGYSADRADLISTSNVVTSEVVRHLFEADLVIADLSDSNPNVYYEVGVRQSADKPMFYLCEYGQSLPFDMTNRVVFYNLSDPESCYEVRQKLVDFVNNINGYNRMMASPVAQYLMSNCRVGPNSSSESSIVTRFDDIFSSQGVGVRSREGRSSIAGWYECYLPSAWACRKDRGKTQFVMKRINFKPDPDGNGLLYVNYGVDEPLFRGYAVFSPKFIIIMSYNSNNNAEMEIVLLFATEENYATDLKGVVVGVDEGNSSLMTCRPMYLVRVPESDVPENRDGERLPFESLPEEAKVYLTDDRANPKVRWYDKVGEDWKINMLDLLKIADW